METINNMFNEIYFHKDIYLIVSFILFSIVIVYAYYGNRRLKKLNQEKIKLKKRLKETKKLLEHSNNNFDNVVNNIKDIIYIVDAETEEFSFLSSAFTKSLGYSEKDIKDFGGRKVFMTNVLEGDNFVHQSEHFKKIANSEINEVNEVNDQWGAWWKCKDGSLKYFEDVWIPIYEENVLISTIGVLRDLTSRIEYEETIHKLANQATLLYKVGRRVSRKLNLDDLLSEVVTAIQETFRYYGVMILLVDESKNTLVLKAIVGEHSEIFENDLSIPIGEGILGTAAKKCKTQISNNVEQCSTYLRYKNERTKSELAVPIIKDNKVLAVLDIQSDKENIFDQSTIEIMEAMGSQIAISIENSKLYEQAKKEINQRKIIEDALRESKEKYRYLVENINDVIFSIVENGVVEYISPAIKRVLGYEPTQVVNKSFKEYFHKEDWERFEKRFENYDLEKPITNDYRMLKKTGDIVWIRISEKPTIINDSVFSSRGVLTDITEKKILENKLIQSQKLESIGHLAAGVAHEINTPIQFIGDNTRFISDVFSDLTSLQKLHIDLFENIQKGNDFDTLIKNIESKLENVDTNFIFEEVPKAISETLEGVEKIATIIQTMKNFSHQEDEVKIESNINKIIESTISISKNEWKNIAELEHDLQENLPTICCLSGQINQVILNLITNASYSITDEIEAGRYEKGKIYISTKEIDGYLKILLKDNGHGMPEDIKDKVFNPFFTTKDVGKGTGQGLSSAYDIIVNNHKGLINFESELGIGTTFTIQLPTN